MVAASRRGVRNDLEKKRLAEVMSPPSILAVHVQNVTPQNQPVSYYRSGRF